MKKKKKYINYTPEKLNEIFSKCKKIVKEHKGTLLTKSYNSINTRLRIQCSNGHLFTKDYKKLQQAKWCRRCKFYKNENICKCIFESLFECKFNKCRPKWLKNPKTNRTLELDGYNEELGIAFEYDGEFHYKRAKAKNYTSKKVLNQQERDRIKDKLCKENNIKLIRIPYTIKKEDYQDHIIKQCYIHNLNIINLNKVNIKDIKHYCTKLEEIKEYAKNNNLELLSKIYHKSTDKLEWKCYNNHQFQITYYNLQKRKNKCKECKSK